ncbi:MAG: triose-phosphate isomerase [Alicyclobacillaceae bacterium]|nr:triose-phosphate isomerase [Alicyclobacillaceae bacterium]
MTRRKLLMGNWKMYKTHTEAVDFARRLAERESELPHGPEYAVCPPFTALASLGAALPRRVQLGAQNVHFEPQGAFTGEVSAGMLAALGVRYVIVGHSERRHIFNESDAWVRRKVRAAVSAGLIPVVCVGEDLRQRELDHTLRVVERQTLAGLAELSPQEAASCVIAYEPVWAIGSGLTPTPADADRIIRSIRDVVAAEKGEAAAAAVRILYGGSVKPDNIASFTSRPDIDGALVGGASLDPDSFLQMAEAVAEGV